MHIPDGFLSPPVWTTLDVAAFPAVAWAARRAQYELEVQDGRRIPLLGVMGAFVFAAQMMNFPVGLGTSGHLVGGALLAITLGPSAAATVMTAVLILQAFLLQDGGVMALGANILNMAIAGVLIGYIPYRLCGRGRTRAVAIFLAGAASVSVSAGLALSELLISGVAMPRRLVLISGILFLANGIIEGAITVAAVRAMERLNPAWVGPAEPVRARSFAVAAVAACFVIGVGTWIASSAPDALEALLTLRGDIHSVWLRKALLGMTGMVILYVGLLLVGRRLRPRSA